MSVAPEAQSKRRNRVMLVGLFAIAVVPLFGAYLLYEGSRSADPWATTNRGELMHPIVSVSELDLTANERTDSGTLSMNASGNWWLVTVTNGACEPDCETALHQLRALHVLLGKDADRVKRALIEQGIDEPEAALVQSYPEVDWFGGPVNALIPGVYIIDPLGNVVLRYPYADAGKPVLEDLKKLLKVSHIG